MSTQVQGDTLSLKQAVGLLRQRAEPDGLSIQSILEIFGSRSYALLILIFSIPFAQPVPTMGLSAVFGFVIMILGFSLAVDRKPWLPKSILRCRLGKKLAESCCDALIWILSRAEKLIKPRYAFVYQMRAVRVLNGLFIVIFAFLMCLPLPIPFSNAIPACFLIVSAIGALETDAMLLILSYIIAAGGAVFFVGIGYGVVEIISLAIGWQ